MATLCLEIIIPVNGKCHIYLILCGDDFYTLHRIVLGTIQYAFDPSKCCNSQDLFELFCSILVGLIWNKIATEFDNWEVELTFKIAGRGRVGADGLVSFAGTLVKSQALG